MLEPHAGAETDISCLCMPMASDALMPMRRLCFGCAWLQSGLCPKCSICVKLWKRTLHIRHNQPDAHVLSQLVIHVRASCFADKCAAETFEQW